MLLFYVLTQFQQANVTIFDLEKKVIIPELFFLLQMSLSDLGKKCYILFFDIKTRWIFWKWASVIYHHTQQPQGRLTQSKISPPPQNFFFCLTEVVDKNRYNSGLKNSIFIKIAFFDIKYWVESILSKICATPPKKIFFCLTEVAYKNRYNSGLKNSIFIKIAFFNITYLVESILSKICPPPKKNFFLPHRKSWYKPL